jgi:PIN domain-containing protein
MKNKKWVFVDHENVGHLNDFETDDIDKIFVFVGATHKTLKINFIKLNDNVSLDIIKIKKIGENNLDFHLAYHLGKLDVTSDLDIEFIVLSADKGFDHLIQYVNDNGRICYRETRKSLVEDVIKVEKTDVKTDVVDKGARIKEKTSKGLVGDSKDIERVSEGMLNDKVDHVLDGLRKLSGNKRPRKIQTLKNYIKTIEKDHIDEIVKKLISNGAIYEMSGAVTYEIDTDSVPMDENINIEGFRELIANLKNLSGNKRPRKLKTLKNHINTLKKGKSSLLLKSLEKSKVIEVIEGDKVKYDLKYMKKVSNMSHA